MEIIIQQLFAMEREIRFTERAKQRSSANLRDPIHTFHMGKLRGLEISYHLLCQRIVWFYGYKVKI